MENIQTNHQDFLPKTKLVEALTVLLEKPQEEILLSEIEEALEPFWESRPTETPRTVISNPEAMNKLAELIQQYTYAALQG